MIGNVTGEGAGGGAVKKKLTNKQRLLSIDMKTKVVQHVPRMNISKHCQTDTFGSQLLSKTFDIFFKCPAGNQVLDDCCWSRVMG